MQSTQEIIIQFFRSIEHVYQIHCTTIANLSDKSKNILSKMINGDETLDENEITPEIYRLVAIIKHCKGDLVSAEKYFLLAAEMIDGYEVVYNLAVFYEIQNDLVLAKKYYLTAAEKGSYHSIIRIANIYHGEKNYDGALKYYLLAIAARGQPFPMYKAAIIYNKQKQVYLAKKYHRLAIAQNYARSMNALAVIYSDEGEFDMAVQYYLMAIDNGYDESMRLLAIMYDKKGNIELCIKYYSMYLEKFSDIPSIFKLAQLHHKRKNHEFAKKFYLMCAEKDNGNNGDFLELSMYNLGMLNMERFNFVDAIECFKAAIAKSKTYKEEYVNKLLKCGHQSNKAIFDAIKNEQKIKELENRIQELMYMPGGIGYQESKENFKKLSKYN